MPPHPLRLLLSALAVFLLAVLPLHGDDLTINAEVGFGGYLRAGKWVPIMVKVDNQPRKATPGDKSADFNGQLVITNAPREGGDLSFQFSRNVTVPAFSSQVFFLYGRFNDSPKSAAKLEVRAENGKLLREIPLQPNPLPRRSSLLLTLTGQFHALQLPLPKPAVDFMAKATVSPAALPDQWQGFDSADVLMIPGWPDTVISPEKVRAIREWVQMGGTLMFLGGAQTASYEQCPLADLMGVTLKGSESCLVTGSGSSLQLLPGGKGAGSLLVSQVEPASGTQVMQAVSGRPLLTRRFSGAGQVIVCALDFETLPSSLADLTRPYWTGLLPLTNRASGEWALPERIKEMTIVTGVAARPPNLALIVLICILYTLAVGPVNFRMLGKRNKVEWAWFTVPAIVIAFSTMIFIIGALTKGGLIIAREVTWREGVANDPVLAARSWLGFFVPSQGTYKVTPGKDGTVVGDVTRWADQEPFLGRGVFGLVGNLAPSPGLGLGSGVPVIATRPGRVEVAGWPLRTFDATTVEVRRTTTMTGALEAEGVTLVSRSSASGYSHFEGTLRNRTGQDYAHVLLVYGGSALEFRTAEERGLKNGASIDLSQYPIDDTAPASLAGKKWFMLKEELDSPLFNPGSQAEDSESVDMANCGKAVRAMFLPAMSGGLFPPRSGDLFLLGISRSDDIDLPVGIVPTTKSHARIDCIRIPFTCRKQFSLPAGKLRLRLHDYNTKESGTFAFEAGRDQPVVNNSDVIMSADLPFSGSNVHVRRISQLRQSGKAPEEFDAELQVLNQATGRWMSADIPAVQENADEAFAAPGNGRLYLRFQAYRKQDAQRNWGAEDPRLGDLSCILEGTAEED